MFKRKAWGTDKRILQIYIARLCMIYYCSIYSANMSSTNALQVARTDIQSGEKTESLSKLKLSTWWPIHAHANTYARLGSGAPQSAQMQFSLFCNNSSISFAIFAGRQRWMWVDNISETAMTLISKKLERLEGGKLHLRFWLIVCALSWTYMCLLKVGTEYSSASTRKLCHATPWWKEP